MRGTIYPAGGFNDYSGLKMRTLNIGGAAVHVTASTKTIIFNTQNGSLFSQAIPSEQRISSARLQAMITTFIQSAASQDLPDITEIIVNHTHEGFYALRRQEKQRQGTYSVYTTYHHQEGRWIVRERNIKNKLY